MLSINKALAALHSHSSPPIQEKYTLADIGKVKGELGSEMDPLKDQITAAVEYDDVQQLFSRINNSYHFYQHATKPILNADKSTYDPNILVPLKKISHYIPSWQAPDRASCAVADFLKTHHIPSDTSK